MKTMRRSAESRSSARSAGRVDEAGVSLLELVISLSLFVGISLATHASLLSGMKQEGESQSEYLAFVFLRDAMAEAQDIANRPYNPGLSEGIAFLWQRYDNLTRSLGGLENGVLDMRVFANETAVPAEFGGPQDLNFDGDALDDLDNALGGPDLKLVPIQITVSWLEATTTRTITLQRLVARTAN